MATCYDCIHCEVCSGIGSCSYHCSDVSKCKYFKNKADVVEVKPLIEWLKGTGKYFKCMENTKELTKLIGYIIDHISGVKMDERDDENGIKKQNN